MIVIKSQTYVPRTQGEAIAEFLLNPSDELYREWWPGMHLAFHPLNDATGVGQLVYMDEYVGKRRLRMKAVVTEAAPTRVSWRLMKLIDLPVWVTIELDNDDEGVAVTHTIRAGLSGPGRLLDPALRLFLPAGFAKDMDEHVEIEFGRLQDILE